jgi:C4-dicarboxylate-specific signal transduction histidine kinase
MTRRSGAGGKPVKARRRKAAAPKRRNAPKVVPRRVSSIASRDRQIARLTRELNEALQQQAATSEVLEVISTSPGDLQRVFDTMLENARRICDAGFGNIYRWDGDALRLIATHNTPPAFAEFRKNPFRPGPTSMIGRMVTTKTVTHVPDAAANRDYTERRDPSLVAAIDLGGVRTYLAVPMLKENELIGAFTVYRQEVRPFTDRQIALITSFASQAVIAIENARLLSELHQRTHELGRSVDELRTLGEISKARTRELAKSLDMLQRERNNKLMNLEAMAASIGHEVRQPMGAIASNAGAALRFLARAPPDLEEARSALNRIVRDGHRAGEIFDNIRALFGKAERRQEPIDVNELATGVLQALREELTDHNITTHVELTSELPPVMGHRGQLQEVLINLVHNAIEAMAAIKDDRRVLQVRAGHHDGNAIMVAVEDSGPGINPKQLGSIFDPFVTTKPHGMGLGLAICRMIIERHEGQLSASPAHPRGCVFRVVLPAGRPT